MSCKYGFEFEQRADWKEATDFYSVWGGIVYWIVQRAKNSKFWWEVVDLFSTVIEMAVFPEFCPERYMGKDWEYSHVKESFFFSRRHKKTLELNGCEPTPPWEHLRLRLLARLHDPPEEAPVLDEYFVQELHEEFKAAPRCDA